MSNLSRLDAQLQDAQSGILVEDITKTVELLQSKIGLNPVTNTRWTIEQIAHIVCKLPDIDWSNYAGSTFCRMECELLKELISDMRLDAIQYQNALNDIASQLNISDMHVEIDEIEAINKLNEIDAIIKLARNMGV